MTEAAGCAVVVPLHELRHATAVLRDALIHRRGHGSAAVTRALTTLTTHAVAAGPRFTDRVLALVDAATPTPQPEHIRRALDELAVILHLDSSIPPFTEPLADSDEQLLLF